ncbi:MAG: DUF4091 domain-containing protein [Kiritimatiellae bacterium]|nr:DUF4091 domain-containing protein [Kiritimatiellia bacterium]
MNTGLLLLAILAPWHTDLSAGLDGIWRRRLAVELTNASPTAAVAETVELDLAPLAGARVAELRVAIEPDTELLYDIVTTTGRSRREGTVLVGDRLCVPVHLGAGGVVRLYVYADNPRAAPVPEFWRAGLRNGAFEFAERGRPHDWQPATTSPAHRTAWSPTAGRGGTAGVTVSVASGAPPAWVQWRQHIPALAGGRRYELSGWVRSHELRGRAGWFVHVHTNGGPPIIRHADLDSRTCDWTRVAVAFDVPTGATSATVGTLLYGDGEAAYDDVTLLPISGGPALKVVSARVEVLPPTPSPPPFEPRFVPGDVVAARVELASPVTTAAPGAVLVDLRPLGGRWYGGRPAGGLRATRPDGTPVGAVRLGELALLERAPDAPAAWDVFLCDLAAAPLELSAFPTTDNLAPPLCSADGRSPGRSWRFQGRADLARAGAHMVDGVPTLEFDSTAASNAWTGWTSEPIPVEPGASYVLAGLLKAEGGAAGAAVHAHLRTADGALVPGEWAISTAPGATHHGWTLSSTVFRAPPEAATISLHLTVNRPGVLRHRAVYLARVERGRIAALAAPGAAAGPSPRLWNADPLVKIFRDDPPPAAAAAPIRLRAARGEAEVAQLAVYAGDAPREVVLEPTPLRGPGGSTLTAEVAAVGYVPVDHPSGYFRDDGPPGHRRRPRRGGSTDGWAAEWPDPLVPTNRARVEARCNQPFWITIRVPDSAPSALHEGSVQVRIDGRMFAEVPLSVEVLPLTLPRRPSLQILLDLRTGPGGDFGSGIAEVGGGRRRAWLKLLAEHRVGIDRILPEPEFRRLNGQVEMDSAAYEAEAAYCFNELGMAAAYAPHFFYLFGWAYRPSSRFGLEAMSTEWKSAMQQAARLFADRMRARGWHDRYLLYIADEPHVHHQFVVEQMRELCRMYHESGARLPIYSSTWRHCAAWDDALDVWGVGQYGCFPVETMERLRAAGRGILFTCDGQMAIDTPYLATERLLPYYCYRYGARGYEFWGVSWWTFDPWRFGWHSYIRQSDDGAHYYFTRYPNGDGYLAYPGASVGVEGPVPSIRLAQVREGAEDYELLKLLEAVGGAASPALAAARELVPIPNAGGLRSLSILPDPAAVRRVRERVLDELTARR